MTEPGKNRSPLELEVMELLELRESLQKEVAELRVIYEEEVDRARVVRRNICAGDVERLLGALRDRLSSVRDTVVTIGYCVELMEELRDLKEGV